MPADKPYLLFCAGEDSGDCIGNALIKASYDYFKELSLPSFPIKFVGAGGARMVGAGLEPLINYEALPVSGFVDVLPKYLTLRRHFNKLKAALKNPLCVGLVAIDYPGFNMKLAQMAGRLNKPSLYVAPPQVWAWKENRAKRLAKIPKTKLAVFFDFEKTPYEKAGCDVDLLLHPYVESSSKIFRKEGSPKGVVLLMPGSRKSQMLRNVPVFLEVARRMPQERFIFVAARENLLPYLKSCVLRCLKSMGPLQVDFEVAPFEGVRRNEFFQDAVGALTAPGTATLELALSGCPFVVCMKPDFMTYALGRLLVKTKYFSLPNIIWGRRLFDEFVQNSWSGSKFNEVARCLQDAIAQKKSCAQNLRSLLLENHKTSKQLMSEFLAQFV